ncbi:MAG: hypothetical protein U5O16_00750 [Rhodococcus sp. (in: high G+C Gram-positive bacteria)]|uniref:hypothetical protein n=1 Tax=Rhodococcus sp. TaxID=1831 RepID=UPI002AD81DD7|nr:hypothetical protein [Rhodococcus sp. (in: high G+C Gram-positive bacteria)]
MKRTFLGCVLALTTASALLGCSSSGPADLAGSEARTVTIDTIVGPTQITGTPERIVAFGQQWVDALLEFDVQPVGYVSAGSYGDERELFPCQTGGSGRCCHARRGGRRTDGWCCTDGGNRRARA